MKPAALYEKLTAVHCEAIAERFVQIMHAQASGKARGTVTAARLTELWEDLNEWAGAPTDRLIESS